MSDRASEHSDGAVQPPSGAVIVTVEAMSEALSAAQGTDDRPEQVLLSHWDKGNCWEFSDDGGLTWQHLVEGNPGDDTLSSRLRAVLSGRSDPKAWGDADGSSLVICEAEIGTVAHHVSGRFSLTLLSDVSGSDSMATETHHCSDAIGGLVFTAAQGEGTEVTHAGTLVALGAASCISMPAAAEGNLDFVAGGLFDGAWHQEDPADQAVPVLLAQLSDGGWRAKPIGVPAVAVVPDDEIGLDPESEFPWFELPHEDGIDAVLDGLLYGRMCDDAFWGDEDDEGEADSGALDEVHTLSRYWRVLARTRALLLSIRDDVCAESSPTASGVHKRVEDALEPLCVVPAMMPLEELFDGLEGVTLRLDGPLLGVGCDPHARLMETTADLLDRMEAACLVGLTALAASFLTSSGTTSESTTELQEDLLPVVQDAARSGVGVLGPDCAKWRQAAENLRRDLRKGRSGKHRTERTPERTVALARKLLIKSEDVLGPASSLIPPPLQAPDPEESGFDILCQERGWHQTPAGHWRLGDDVRMPLLMAGSDNASAPPSLLLMPPTEGPLVETWQVPSHWEEEMLSHGAEAVHTTPVGDAYSSCPECLCPLPERTERQTCPSCGHQVDTFAMPQAVKSLDALSALFETEEDAARAAVELSGPFRAWLLVLTAQIG